MEFVYLVTRTETLREHLDDQGRQERKAFDAVLAAMECLSGQSRRPLARCSATHQGNVCKRGAATVCPGLPSVYKGLKTPPNFAQRAAGVGQVADVHPAPLDGPLMDGNATSQS